MGSRRSTRIAAWFSVLLLWYLPACASFNELTGPTAVPGVVATVEVTNAQPQLAVGASLPLQALMRDANGNPVVDRTVSWSSSDAAIATVSAEGVVTGIGVGIVKIAASVQGRSATATLNVTARPVASVLVNPPSPSVLVGGQLQLSSVTLGESGDVLAGRRVFWSTSNPLVASIDNTGLLTGLSPGATTITATSENRSASVGVSVLQVPVATVQISPALDTVVVGQTTQLTAVARDSIGTPRADRPIAWSSSSGAIATVSASGLVVGAAAGAVTITASSESKSGTSRIVVLPRPVGSVIVSPAQMAITAGQSVKLTVLITDNNGTLLSGRPIQYQSGNASIATVAADGTVLGVNAGSTIITVTSEGRTGTANVDVSASPVATVRVNLAAPELSIGATQKVTATLLDANNNVLPPRPITWTSGAPGVASVAADGTVSALSAGTAVIFATVEGKLASATLIVREITVVSVVVAPPTVSIFVGDAFDLSTQARDVSGTVIAGRSISWRSSDDRIAVVSSTGRVRALAVGQALITASVDGVDGSSAITTLVEPVLTVTVEPPTLSMLPATSTTIVPTARGRNGAVLSGRAFVFASLDPTIATVNQNGLVSALRTGNTAITVTSEGKQASVPVNVSPAPVATVGVTLGNSTRLVSQITQATASPRDAAGAALTGRPVVWTSSDVAVATVNAAGVVTAVGPGTANIIATVEGKSGQAAIAVALVPVANVAASLAAPTRFFGQTTQATAVTTDSIGGLLSGRTIAWTTSNAAVATVSASGLVTTIAPGSANIIAVSEGKTGTATITVTVWPVAKVSVTVANAGPFVLQSTQATPVLTDANNVVLTGRAITWTSSNPLVASVSSTGLVTGVSPGTANIIATSEGISGSALVTVTLAPVASVIVTLPNPKPYVTQTTQAAVVLRDALGNVLTGRVVVWSTSDATVATVSAAGVVTAVSPNSGPTTVIAISEGVQGSAPITVALVPVSTVNVTIAQPGLQPGQTSQATAATLDSINGVLTGRVITWLSSNTSVATVSATGLVTAVAPGNASITATSEGKTGLAPVTVTLIPVASVSVNIDKAALFVAQKAQVTSTTRDVNGNILTGRLTTWLSSDVTIATVTSAGVVTAVGPGTATITGNSEGIQGTVQVTVALAPVAFVSVAVNSTSLLVGQTTQATAILSDAASNTVTGRVVVFSSSNAGVATVDQAGVVTAVGAGAVNIIATSEGQSGFVTINVSTVPVNSVSIALGGTNPNNFYVGATNQATATTRDVSGAVLAGRLVTWSSSNTAVATVNASGLVTMVAPGTSDIIAQSEGKSAQSVIIVTIAPVATVSVSLNSASLFPLQGTQASVVLRDVNGTILTARAVVWSSANPLVASVSQSGAVGALLPGTAAITATSEGVQGSAMLTVSLAPVATVTTTLAPASVLAGQTSQASAVTRDAFGNVLTGRIITWTTSNGAVATVDVNGLVTSVAPGTADITATSEGRSGFATLSVAQVPVATVTVGLTPAAVFVGQTSQAAATTRDASNNVLGGRIVTWQSSNTSVATVNASGVVTAVAPGTADITATSEGQSGFATLSVSVVPVATVSVSLPGNANSFLVGATVQATVITRDGNGAQLSGRLITWSSTNPAVATVNASGFISMVGPGSADIVAQSEGKSGQVTVIVSVPPVATVSVALVPTSVIAGQTSQANATTRDASNNIVTGRLITWQSSNTAVATVNASGLVTTLTAGTSNITATSEGQSGFGTLTVTAVPVASVSVVVAPTSVVAGQTSQATATTRDALNNVLTGRVITWQSSNTAVATVDAAGLVTTLTAGTSNITATSEGQSGFAPLTVTAPPPVPVATVSVVVAPTSVIAGQTSQATATTRDALNNVLTGRIITWQSSNTAVATVDAAGLVTTLTTGASNITATSEGQSGFAPLTVTAPPPAPVATVSVVVAPTSVIAGQSSQATATTRDASNNVLTGRVITWQSSNTAVATVDAAGLVTTLTAGTSNITATSEGQSGFAPLTVTALPPAPVATVSVVVAPTSVIAGQSSQATATTRDASNNVLTGRVITWQSSNTAVATVDAAGLVTTLTAGTSNITATSEGQSGFAPLTVTALPPAPVATVSVVVAPTSVIAGQSSQATATTRDASNNVLTGRVITWQSSNTSVATVDAAGLVTTLTAGTSNITATSEGQSGFAPLTVTAPPPAPVATVSVVVAPTSVIAGQTSQATATTRDALNNVLTGRVITWQSSNTAVATVDAAGLVTTLTAGTSNITATSEGQSGFAPLTVTGPPPAPVATVSVVVAPTSVIAGQTSQATATTRDANNNVLTGRVITWQSSNTSVATVDAAGLVTTLTAGTSNITATSEGQSGFAPLTVTAPPPVPVATVSVVVAPTSVIAGQTSQATATTRDAGNNVLTGRVITWQSSNTAVATVDAAGLVTTLTAGTSNITATSEGQSGFAPLTVTAPPPVPVATVSVVVAPTSVIAGQTSQATATTRDAGNNVLTGRVITWQSSNTAVATVDAAGLVTTLTAGTSNITATSEGQSGFAPLTVTAPPPVPVATVSVVVAPTSVIAGQTSQATATTRDAGNNVLTGRVITWQSSNTAVATVDAAGLVTTLTAGSSNITATSEGQSGFAPLTVTAPPPVPVATVSVVVAPTSVIAGQTSQATATTRDASNNVLTGRVITWQSSNTAVATVDAAGLVTTLTAGTSNITATSEGQSGFAPLTVTAPPPAPVATVSVVVAPASVIAGQTSQATATTRDALNNVLTGRLITWQSSNTAVATVDAAGLVTTLTAGTSNITATSEGQSNFATLTVTAPPPAPVATVSVVVAPTSVIAGQTSQATATTRDASNNVLTGRVITWQSSNTSVATVDAAGLVTTLTAGTSNITATSEGQSGLATLTVTAPPPAPVATVSVVVAPTSVIAGQTSQATATTRDASNNVLTGRVITWQSSNTAVATVDATGLVTTLTAGSSNITATSEGQSGFAPLTVTAPPPVPVATVSVVVAPTSVIAGQTSQATATTRDASNNVLTGRVITWQSSNTAVATVDAAGLVTTLTAGTSNITATSEGQSGFAPLTVTAPPPAPVATVSVVVAPASVIAGQTSQATATTRDASNNVLTGRVITWQSSNTAVATVDAAGLVTTLTAGTSNITATSEGQSGFAPLTVTAPPPAPVATVSVVVAPTSVIAGQSSQATATTRDASNNVLTGRVITWQSSNTSVATVDAAGLVTTLTAGTSNITATSEGQSGLATLTVTAPPPAPVATVSVVVAPTSVIAGQTSQATATTRDAGNNVLTGRVITWQSSNTAVATVDAAGLVTTLTAGTSNITATSEGQSGFAPLTVTAPPPAPVATVSVVVAPTSVIAGQTSQATATTRDALNNVLTGRVITWQSSNTAVATVDAAGLVTTLTAGTSNITATSEGQSGFAPLTVTAPPPAPVATVSVVVAPTSVIAGQTSQATATTRDASNNVLTGRVIAWQSSNTAVATVDAAGLVTTLTAGTSNITATSEGQSNFATLTVTAPPPAPVATVSVVVAPTSVIAGQTSQATATTRDAGNNVLTGRVITWQSSNTAVATVDVNGLVTTLIAGGTNITATSEGQSGFATLVVSTPPPATTATVTVVLNPTSVIVGQNSQAGATTLDASGNVLTGRPISWQSSNTTVATINGVGTITTLAAGTADIIATSDGKTGFATLTVTAAAGQVATISVALTPPSVVLGQTSQGTATPRDGNGNPVPVQNTQWDSSDQTVASVNGNGLVTTLKVGTTDIIAKAHGRTGSATLTVTPPMTSVGSAVVMVP